MGAKLADGADALAVTARYVGHADNFVFDVEKLITRQGEGGTLSFKLKDYQTVVVASSKQVELRVGS